MSDTSLREWRFYLDDMLDFAGRVLTYTEGWTSPVSLRAASPMTRRCATWSLSVKPPPMYRTKYGRRIPKSLGE